MSTSTFQRRMIQDEPRLFTSLPFQTREQAMGKNPLFDDPPPPTRGIDRALNQNRVIRDT